MNLTQLSATELAKRIKEGRTSAQEVLEAFIRRVERFNSSINAVVTMDLEEARQQAERADQALADNGDVGPLHGVPITVKDTWDTQGLATTVGIPWLKKNRPNQNAVLVERLQRAGAIIWGKSNLPLSSYDWQCKNPLFGRTHNPWKHNHIPGGSSGGSAAALAACFTPLELGSDVAGSIRYPAHCCGIYGLRTTTGLLSTEGHGNLPGVVHSMRNLVSVGPMARNPEDLKLAMDVLIEPQSEAGKMARIAPSSRSLSGARIAWTDRFADIPICSETRAALENTVAALKEAGAHLQRVDSPVDVMGAMEVWGRIQGFEFRSASPWISRLWPTSWLLRLFFFPFIFGRGFASVFGKGFTSSSSGYFDALEKQDHIQEQTDQFFREWDFWLTPVSSTAAFPYQRMGKAVQVDGSPVSYGYVAGIFNCPTAVMGHPILTIPVGLTAQGLPVGLQLHARRFHDYALISLASEIRSCLGEIAPPSLT